MARIFIGAGGIKLVGDVDGDPAAPPVILLHGGGQTRHSWRHAMRALVEEGFHVINLDARGHGDSEWPADGDYSLETMGADLRAVVATLPHRPALVGASMGGLASLTAIDSQPDICSALVLVDIVPHTNAGGTDRIRSFMAQHTQGFASLSEAYDAVRRYNPLRRPTAEAGLMKNLRLREDGRLYWHWDPRFLEAIQNRDDAVRAETLARAAQVVRVPTLLVRGLRSDVVTDEGADKLKALIPHLKIFNVADANHMVAGDNNDVFTDAVTGFIREADALEGSQRGV